MSSKPLRGERRPVTVFADAHDPEEVCRILNHCFDCSILRAEAPLAPPLCFL
jgi:hypothetical protein